MPNTQTQTQTQTQHFQINPSDLTQIEAHQDYLDDYAELPWLPSCLTLHELSDLELELYAN